MGASLTADGRALMIEAFWTPDIFVAIPTLYICLTRTVPVSNAAPEDLEEPDPLTGYDRVPYPLDSAYWTPDGFGQIFNNDGSRFFAAPDDDWGLLQGMALITSDVIDGVTGTVVAVGNLDEPFQPAIGETIPVDVGDITIGLFV